ncbi:MAG TPA: CDP-glucose 4,6-dehydratase [Sphingomonas sp.]|nr:CDP-glucose 4,6-dehydratase [Sphingomonas sp.]
MSNAIAFVPEAGSALRGRRVLVTGHTGFKGSWLCLWLHALGAEVYGIALAPPPGRSLFRTAKVDQVVDGRIADIRDPAALATAAHGIDAEIVFHLAAEAIVLRSQRDPATTFATNVSGTAHVLDLARTMPSLRAIIVVTSDKCYRNDEGLWPFRETDRLGGHDPYSASKACTELVVEAYRATFFARPGGAKLATVRAGNVIGGGDEAEDRLVPDIARAARGGAAMAIRNPGSIRPWQHVLEPLRGYLMVADRLLGDEPDGFAGAWNFGPDVGQAVDVGTVAAAMMARLDSRCPVHIAPRGAASGTEARTLRLDSSKAAALLGWRPQLSFDEMMALTGDWYAADIDGGVDMAAFTDRQLSTYRARCAPVAIEELRICG